MRMVLKTNSITSFIEDSVENSTGFDLCYCFVFGGSVSPFLLGGGHRALKNTNSIILVLR